MRPIVVQAFITLDGVVQGGGGPDEDPSGGFPYGGWTMDYDAQHESPTDENYVEEWESHTEMLLLGRTTYDIWAQAWGVWPEDAPGFAGELTRLYNRIPKHVASRTVTEFGWTGTTSLGSDVATTVRALRELPATEPGGEIRIWGSTQLVAELAAHGLVDEYRLAVYPLVLGTGKKLFPTGFPLSRLTLAASRELPSGVVLNTYRRGIRQS